VILFTDGVLEARNTRGEEFGEDRLREFLRRNASSSAEEILARLQQEISDFSAGTPQHDDITMMVLGYDDGLATSSA
jgi:sigma-B regulation protein RsbU (phosphoserine phosphatase)